MEKVRLAIVGCGGMGNRHLRALVELQSKGLSRFELVGTCDPVAANASLLADEAERRLGTRPAIALNQEDLEPLDVQAVDVTATPRYHHGVVSEALQRGWHVMCEKPVGLTVASCRVMEEAHARSGLILSVAENFRRDPMNRLGKALLEAGVIGNPHIMVHNVFGGADLMTISVWRHMKDQSGVLLDVGVHFTDILEYYLGKATTVFGQTRLHEKVRRNPAAGKDNDMTSNPAGIYSRWQKVMPSTFEPTAEDASYGTIAFESGAVAQFAEDHAAHGRGFFQRNLYGSQGSLDLPKDRSGGQLTVHLSGGESISGEAVLDLVPDFALEPATAALFGGDRLWQYSLPFTEIDPRIIAIEYAEFGRAIIEGETVEVDLEQGKRSVALAYALLESNAAGRAVSMEEVLSGQLNTYQLEIDEGLSLVY